ncbi:MAG: hypothetical protein CL610_01815 [Anaerolineaceae bacterium]|nr:hypothetical protein [Anaerolineaceae bacterium]
MIEHPVLTNDLGKLRYEEMLQEAARNRRINALVATDDVNHESNSLVNWLHELRFWGKTTRRAATRA